MKSLPREMDKLRQVLEQARLDEPVSAAESERAMAKNRAGCGEGTPELDRVLAQARIEEPVTLVEIEHGWVRFGEPDEEHTTVSRWLADVSRVRWNTLFDRWRHSQLARAVGVLLLVSIAVLLLGYLYTSRMRLEDGGGMYGGRTHERLFDEGGRRSMGR